MRHFLAADVFDFGNMVGIATYSWNDPTKRISVCFGIDELDEVIERLEELREGDRRFKRGGQGNGEAT
jgi:hypothetical protein